MPSKQMQVEKLRFSQATTTRLPTNKIRKGVAAAIALAVLLLGGIAPLHPAQSETLRLVTGTDYAPYTSPTLPKGGVITETVQAVLHEAGYDTTLHYYPWKRGFQRVVTGSSDVTFPYAKNDERDKFVLFSRPINNITVHVFYNRGNPVSFTRPEDLSGLTYCEPLGYQTEPTLRALIRTGDVFRAEAQTMDNCFQLLAQGHVDFVVTNDLVAGATGRRVLGAHASETIGRIEKPINESREYLIVSRKNPQAEEIIRRFNESYRRLYERSEIQAIWQRHLGDLIAPPS